MRKYIIEKLKINGYDRFIHIKDLLSAERWYVSAFENSWDEAKMKVGDIIEGELFVQYADKIAKVDKTLMFKQKDKNQTTVEAIVKFLYVNEDKDWVVQSSILENMILKPEEIIDIREGEVFYIEGALSLNLIADDC